MRRKIFTFGLGAFTVAAVLWGSFAPAQAQQARRPNILFIMGDDVGWFNIGAYHRNMMSGKTPNLDKLAAEGMMFTDYYAEASCTALAANTMPSGSLVIANVPLPPAVYRALRSQAASVGQTPAQLMAEILSRAAGN